MRSHSSAELPSEVPPGDGRPPDYPRVVLDWHKARPATWNAQQAYQFLQTCHHLHQLALSIPIRLREHRQMLATTFQLPPIAVRKFLDYDLFGLTATLVFVVAFCACCKEIDLLHALPGHLRLCGSLASTIMQHFPAIQKELLLWTESLAILVLVLQFPGRDAADQRLRQRLVTVQLQISEYTFSRCLSPCVVYLKVPAHWKVTHTEHYRSRSKAFYIGSTSVSMATREWNR